jgi:hypothetical protein
MWLGCRLWYYLARIISRVRLSGLKEGGDGVSSVVVIFDSVGLSVRRDDDTICR